MDIPTTRTILTTPPTIRTIPPTPTTGATLTAPTTATRPVTAQPMIRLTRRRPDIRIPKAAVHRQHPGLPTQTESGTGSAMHRLYAGLQLKRHHNLNQTIPRRALSPATRQTITPPPLPMESGTASARPRLCASLHLNQLRALKATRRLIRIVHLSAKGDSAPDR